MAISLFEMNEVISKKEVIEILSQEKGSLTKFVEDVCKEFIEQSWCHISWYIKNN